MLFARTILFSAQYTFRYQLFKFFKCLIMFLFIFYWALNVLIWHYFDSITKKIAPVLCGWRVLQLLWSQKISLIINVNRFLENFFIWDVISKWSKLFAFLKTVITPVVMDRYRKIKCCQIVIIWYTIFVLELLFNYHKLESGCYLKICKLINRNLKQQLQFKTIEKQYKNCKPYFETIWFF